MKSLLFISLSLFLAGLGTASKHATKTSSDLPTYTVTPQSKGLPPPPAHGFTKGLPPSPVQELTKGLPPSPVQELTKGLPPKDKVTTSKGAAPPTPGDTPPNPIEAIGSLTPECQAALFSIVANPEFFKCVPITALLPLLPVLTDPTVLPGLLKDPAKNLPPLLGPVFDGICAAPKCSDEGVATSLKALDEGCKADEKNLLIKIATGVVTFYSPLRDTICFKDNKKEYCVFETLEKITSLPQPPVKVIDGGFIDALAFSEPKEICTPCNKAIVNTIFNFLNADTNHSVEFLASIGVPSTFITIGKLFVGVKCGYQFLDGNVGHPEDTNPDDFNYQLSQALPETVVSGASSIKGVSLTMMIGAFLVSTFLSI